MTKHKSTKRALLLSALSLLMCVSMLIGSTFAWFTDSVTSTGNKIQAGNLDVDLYLWTAGGSKEITNESAPIFGAGAIAQDNNAETLWEPGKTQVAYLSIKNNGSLDLKYTVAVDVRDADEEQDLYEVMQYAIINDAKYADVTAWNAANGVSVVPGVNATQADDVALKAGEEHFFALTIHMREEAGNEYMNGQVDFDLRVLATQLASEFDSFDNQYDANAKYPPDKWDGTVDTTWHNDTDTEFTLTTAEQLAGLADLVDGGNTFVGKTIKLGSNVDLYCLGNNGEPVSFEPIGYGYNTVFKGTFDGQGYTISNLYQNGWALGLSYSTEGGGLFASVVDATIRNLTIDNAEIVMECIDMGAVVGYSYGKCTYENITVSNSIVANYNRYTGGVVGEVNGTQTFKNVDVVDTTVSALWGTYDAACGGIVGGKWGDAKLTFEDCDVSAKLDVFNDACSNYQYYNYRLCGMLIGMTEEVTDGFATASYLTCKNCTVIYGDWANYTYCESESYGKGSYAAAGEWKCKRIQAGCQYEGIDTNHTHDTDESHEELFVFDQLFGGDKGVKGGKTHSAGVTVIYNNK